jgi:gonadotropin-releasing hormone receptor
MHSDAVLTTPAAESTPVTDSLTPDMVFNDGHRMSIVTYSVLMVASAVGNLTVLITILKRRRALRFGNNHMFMHLAIADLLVSVRVKTVLYMFIWVFPRRQIVFRRRFGTLCQVRLQRLEVEYEV